MTDGQHQTQQNERITTCFACEGIINTSKDEWWQHGWQEQPSKTTVEKSMEATEFRERFEDTQMFCRSCHKDLIEMIRVRREAA